MENRKRIWGALALMILLGIALDWGGGRLPDAVGARSAAARLALGHPKAEYAEGSKPDVLRAYGKLPLYFEPNQGQTDPRVKYLSRGPGYTLFLTSSEAVLVLPQRTNQAAPREPFRQGGRSEGYDPALLGSKLRSQDDKVVVLRMKLTDANPHPQLSGQDELPGKANYFIGNDSQKWRTNVPTYAKVKYEGVYPGVDLVYYGHQRQLEHDFIVAPGADPGSIRIGFEGAEKLSLDAQGDLVLASKDAEVRFQKPVAYQEVGGVRRETSGRYVLKGALEVGFEVDSYEASRPLVIDPMVLVYSTYLGGNGNDQGNGIAVDSAGSAYVTGFTSSTNFPITSGTFQTTIGGGFGDAFVTKLNPKGSALVYSTYLGGSGEDQGNSIAVDSAGSAYVAGSTGSSNFPTTASAPQTTFRGGGIDAFVTKLNPAGSALVYSTYLGSSRPDEGLGIAVDSAGSAYVTGFTNWIDFPTTPGAFQTTFGGGLNEAFVTKLNPAGSALAYSTYLGGNGDDQGHSIAVDSASSAYVAGSTGSSNFPTTPGAFQTTYGGGDDAFVTKLNAAGSALVYSTYLGGSGQDDGVGIAVDSTGSAYVTGFTRSTNFPTTPGAFQTTYGGGITDAFVTKLNPAGSGLVYSTYLGGNGDDQGNRIAVDSTGSAHLTGGTDSTNFPTTPGAFQTTYGGGVFDAFVAKIMMLHDVGICHLPPPFCYPMYNRQWWGTICDLVPNPCLPIYNPWWWLNCPACGMEILINLGNEFRQVTVFDSLGKKVGKFGRLREPLVEKGVTYNYSIRFKLKEGVAYILKAEPAAGKKLQGDFRPAYFVKTLKALAATH